MGNDVARLRARNQLTIPESVVDTAGLREGDRFVLEATADDPGTIVLHRIRSGYAGSLRDVYGDSVDHLAEERASWGRR